MKEEEDLGIITIGTGTDTPEELKVIEVVQASYLDNRLITISKAEDDSMVISVENPTSSGRLPQSIMRLSEESFIGLMATMTMYYHLKGADLKELLKSVSGKTIEYSSSENLKPKKQ